MTTLHFDSPARNTTANPLRALASGAARVARRCRQGRAAVHHEGMAGDVAREVREQEAHGVADVPAGALDPERGGLAPLVAGRRAHATLIRPSGCRRGPAPRN